MKTRLIFLLFAVASITAALANNADTLRRRHSYKIGDRIPDFTVTNLINAPAAALKLSDFKGRIVILDYWATWCGSCISQFAKEDELQQKYQGKIQFLLVTKENKKTVSDFLARSKKFNRSYPHLVIAYSDTLLHALFGDVTGYPTYAWIDGNGILRNVTGLGQMNDKTINDLLNGQSDIEKEINIDIGKPFFLKGNGGDGSQLQTFSVLSKYIEGVPYWAGGSKYNGISKIYFTNMPVCLLYETAYFYDFLGKDPFFKNLDMYVKHPWLFGVPNNRTVLQVTDTSNLVGRVNDKINKKALFCYQLLVPGASFVAMRKYMQEDFKRYFPYNAGVEKVTHRCLVLTAQDTSLLVSRGGKPDKKEDNYGLSLKNISFLMFDFLLNNESGTPIIDETGFKGNTDIDITADLKDWRSLNKALKKYGLTLHDENRDIYMLIIGKADQNN